MTVILKPEKNVISKCIGRIWVEGNTVFALYPEKDETWRTTCKRLSYGWIMNRWQRTFPDNANKTHRAAELAHRLLLAGFIVDVADEIAQLVTNASYNTENFRKIKRFVAGDYKDWFCIQWGRHEDLYSLATRIPTAHWTGIGVAVSREYFEEVLDFADAHKFMVGDSARELADMAKRDRDSMVVIDVPPLHLEHKVKVVDGRPVLAAPEFVEIDRELMDDEYNDTTA